MCLCETAKPGILSHRVHNYRSKIGLVMRSEQLADGQNRAHGLPDEVKMSSWRTLEGVSLAKKLA